MRYGHRGHGLSRLAYARQSVLGQLGQAQEVEVVEEIVDDKPSIAPLLLAVGAVIIVGMLLEAGRGD